MPENLAEGAVYKIDLRDGKPAHYWIILNEPRADGTFLAVSLTYRLNVPYFADVWKYDYPLTDSFNLPKPSVIPFRFIRIETKEWLESHPTEFIGYCTPEALQRARCNLFWFDGYLRPKIQKYRNWFRGEWLNPCGPCPQNTKEADQNA